MRGADTVLELLASGASQVYYGEPVSQLEHALQAANLAREAGASDATVAAALLHDVGHLLGEGRIHEQLGVIDHDRAGADYLRGLGFGEEVVSLVEGHVAAKRYLVATNPAYAAKLSPASTGTLALQGGPMSPAEMAAFDTDPRKQDKLRLRSWDEQAKIPGADVPPLEAYRALLARVLSSPAGMVEARHQ
jgi:phosphonate degradation associated HDIG domain protein